MTPSQMRAMRAKQLLDSGRDAHEVAKELGYTKVSAMLGAISLCSRKIERDEAKLSDLFGKTLNVVKKEVTENGVRAELVFHTDEPRLDLLADQTEENLQAVSRKEHAEMHGFRKPAAKLYPMENGIMKIGGTLGYVTIKPDVGTVNLNVPTTSGGNRWLMLGGRQLGRDRLLAALKDLAGAINEAIGLIEEGIIDVDHHA